ncbi:TPA: hypothetical protein ACGO1T_000641 [Streptococcus suis]
MRKAKPLLIPLLSALILSACVDLSPTKPAVNGGNAITGDSQATTRSEDDLAVDVAGDKAQTDQRLNNLMNLISTKFVNTQKVTLDLTNSFKGLDTQVDVQQSSQETYDQGAITGYLAQNTLTVDGQSLNYQSYFDGQKRYFNLADTAWIEQEADTKGTTLYLFFVKMLLEGGERWTLNEGVGDLRISKTLEDPELLSILHQFMEVPVIVTPQAKKTVTLDYQVNEETGAILNASVKVIIEDLGNQYEQTLRAKINPEAEFADLKVDTEAQAQAVDTTDQAFADYFAKANPYQLYNYYELYLTDIDGETQIAQLSLDNFLKGQPFMSILSDLEEGELANTKIVYEDKVYGLDGDKTSESDYPQTNIYAYFVDRAIETYDLLEAVETAEEEPTYVLREFISNDFDAFVAAAGPIDVADLAREGESAYGVDYTIDKTTHQLVAVYLWSTDTTEEAVSRLKSISFSRFNLNSPNYVTHNVDPKLWEAIQ